MSAMEFVIAVLLIVVLVALWVCYKVMGCADDMPLLDLLRQVPEGEKIEKELWEK